MDLEYYFKEKMKTLYGYLVKIGADAEDAKDIVQETFCRAVAYMDSIDEKNMSAWLFKVAINQYYALENRKKRYLKIQKSFAGVVEDDASFDIESSIESMHIASKIDSVLDRIGEKNRKLIMLKYDIGLSYREIAVMLNTSENNVKTYLYRARNEFKKVWEETDDEQ